MYIKSLTLIIAKGTAFPIGYGPRSVVSRGISLVSEIDKNNSVSN